MDLHYQNVRRDGYNETLQGQGAHNLPKPGKGENFTEIGVSYDKTGLLTVMIQAPVVHHPGEAGAGLGGGLIDTLPQGLQSKEISRSY